MPKLPSRAPPVLSIGTQTDLLDRARRASAEGRLEDGVRLLRRILTLDPTNLDAINELGCVYANGGALDNALRQFETLLRIDPNQPVAWKNHGLSLQKAGRFNDALASFERMIALLPNHPDGHIYRADTLYYLGRFREAAAAYEPLEAVAPIVAAGRGTALQWCGRYDEAFAAFDRALTMPTAEPVALNNKASLLLLRGDFPEGLKLHEQRWKLLGGDHRQKSTRPMWSGETSLKNKTLYVQWEQGLGDTLQFCRYATLAAEAGARVILSVQPPLLELMATLAGVSRLVTGTDPMPEHDLHCPLMSLPFAFGTTPETIPAAIPYLRADPTRTSIWRDRLAAHSGPRIGLVWGGSSRLGDPTLVATDQRRSLPLTVLAPLASIPGCNFFSLQLGPPADQAAHPPDPLKLHDYTGNLKNFADTAALVENLDLVISVDTSTAHLAGAMGKPVWLLNRFDTCWRWFLDRDDSPWYPAMRIFRQPSSGDWTSVVRAVTEALHSFAAG